MLFTKCILSQPSPEDGKRISVMSRHTLNDGATRDERIRHFDLHIPSLAPSSHLLGDYYRRGLSWEAFEIRYLAEIRTGSKPQYVKSLAYKSLREDITIMCIEPTAEKCHRRLLAEECQRYQPELAVEHR